MPFRATIFDLDGTLLDPLDDIANAANSVLATRGFPPHPNANYRTFIGEGITKLMLRALPKTHQDGVTVHPVSTLVTNPKFDDPRCIEPVK